MRLSPQRVNAFLRDPGKTRVVLLYGEDVGLIGERAVALVRAIVGKTDDPFRSVTVHRGDEILAEVAQVSLGGGRRVVRVPEVGDAVRDAVRAVLEGPSDAMLLLEAPGLSPARSRLLKLVDAHTDGMAIACYAAGTASIANTVRTTLAKQNVAIDENALAWLVSQLGADSALSLREIEKLTLYVGRDGRADLAAAEASVGDVAGLALEDALFAATAGDAATADRALERALAQGTTPVAVIRAGLFHLGRLERAALAVAGGSSPTEAAKAAHVFFRRVPLFTRALDLWSSGPLVEALQTFFVGERDAKRTGVPAGTLCRHLIGTLARDAARFRRG